MKQSVCGSGRAAVTSLARVSNCSSRRLIVRVNGVSLPWQTSRPTAFQVGTDAFHFLRGAGLLPATVRIEDDHARQPFLWMHQQDSDFDGPPAVAIARASSRSSRRDTFRINEASLP
jgi:hypothetical protein